MAVSCEELPEEIWELILNGLGDDHHSEFESLSLVSKRLLSLTDRLRLRFTVVDQTYFVHGSLGEILGCCPEIRHLSIQDCGAIKNIGLNVEPLKLKKLYMARSGVNDEGLLEIGVRCKDLVKIDLSGCLHVTTSAVIYLVRKCEKLREVNLMGCLNLHAFIVDSMVYARPSLRKLIPPSYGVTSEKRRQLLLHHGCHVCDK